jgi:glycosyltransferase involved in cell wall biosynthesis
MQKSSGEPLVSILITSYNREKYLAEAIESVLNSTYKNLEIIIVDNCSSDRSIEIAKEYQKKDGRIKVYVNLSNIGQFNNRNLAASYATGKYLKYVDSDDIIYSHCIQVMVDAMEKFPSAGLGLLKEIEFHGQYPLLLTSHKVIVKELFTGGILTNAAGSTIIRKDIFQSIKCYRYIDAITADTFSLFKIASVSDVIFIQAGLAQDRIHSEQESNNTDIYNNITENLRYKPEIIRKDCSVLSDIEKKLAVKLFYIRIHRHLLRSLFSKNILRVSKLYFQPEMKLKFIFQIFNKISLYSYKL